MVFASLLAATAACGGQSTDAAAAQQLQDTISRVENQLAALAEQLALIEARAAEVEARSAAAAAAPPAPPAVTDHERSEVDTLAVIAEPEGVERLEVVVTASAILIDGKEVAATELQGIFERTARRAKATVVIQAERDVDYQRIVEVMDSAKLAGITQLGVAKPASL